MKNQKQNIQDSVYDNEDLLLHWSILALRLDESDGKYVLRQLIQL